MRLWQRLAVLGCMTLAGCGGPQSAFDAHGESAIALKQLIIGIVAVCSVVWALVMIALIWALLRRRRDKRDDGSYRQRRMAVAVISATAATVVIISGFTLA